MPRFSQITSRRLDVLVNNAGVLTGGELISQSESQIRAMVDVNVTGLTMVSYAAHPLLKATEGAMVINLCSASSIRYPFVGCLQRYQVLCGWIHSNRISSGKMMIYM